MHGFLIAVASLAIEHMGSGCPGFSSCGSRALKCGVSSRGTTDFAMTASHAGTEHCVVLTCRMSSSVYFYEEKLFVGKSGVLREMES